MGARIEYTCQRHFSTSSTSDCDESSLKMFFKQLEYNFPGGSWLEVGETPQTLKVDPKNLPTTQLAKTRQSLSVSATICEEDSKEIPCPAYVGADMKMSVESRPQLHNIPGYPLPEHSLSAMFAAKKVDLVVSFTSADFVAQWLSYFHTAHAALLFVFPAVVTVPCYFRWGAATSRHRSRLCNEDEVSKMPFTSV